MFVLVRSRVVRVPVPDYAEQLQAMSSSNVSVVIRQDLLGMYYQLLSCEPRTYSLLCSPVDGTSSVY